MIVECVTNLFNELPPVIYDNLYGYSSKTELPIEIGQKSLVYCIKTLNKHLWYLVDVDGLKYPMYYPANCFKVVDKRLSKYWIVSEGKDTYDNDTYVINFGFKEIVEDDFFYGELIEDNQKNWEVFLKYKDMFNLELSR